MSVSSEIPACRPARGDGTARRIPAARGEQICFCARRLTRLNGSVFAGVYEESSRPRGGSYFSRSGWVPKSCRQSELFPTSGLCVSQGLAHVLIRDGFLGDHHNMKQGRVLCSRILVVNILHTLQSFFFQASPPPLVNISVTSTVMKVEEKVDKDNWRSRGPSDRRGAGMRLYLGTSPLDRSTSTNVMSANRRLASEPPYQQPLRVRSKASPF